MQHGIESPLTAGLQQGLRHSRSPVPLMLGVQQGLRRVSTPVPISPVLYAWTAVGPSDTQQGLRHASSPVPIMLGQPGVYV